MLKQVINPVSLLVGPEESVIQCIEEKLQAVFCPTARQSADKQVIDCFCRTCRQIKQRQHPSLVWIEPEGNYGVKDVDIIFEKTHFALDQGSQFFFVMSRVHTLNLATANKLLKVLEEPPTGYHFLLYTDNPHSVLPTILSRCVVHNLLSEQTEDRLHPLLNYFCDPTKAADPFGFEALVKKEHLSDTQSIDLLNQLLNHYIKQLKQLLHKNQNEAAHRVESEYLRQIITFITRRLKQPPQSGSSEIFWKLMFISFPQKS